MKKEYIKPEVELIALVATEAITAGIEGEGNNGDTEMESSIF